MRNFATAAVHAGAHRDAVGAISPPLYLTTTMSIVQTASSSRALSIR